MHVLPNNCRVGKFSVFPKNWKTTAADLSATWRINYWFYDDNLLQKKQVKIRGMNNLETLKQKQECVKFLIASELEDLKNGYNPIRGISAEKKEDQMNLVEALNFALSKADHLSRNTFIDVKSALKFMTISMQALKYDTVKISDIRRRHIKDILEGCGNIKTFVDKKGIERNKTWGPCQFNRYRTYLSILFSELVEYDILDANPVREIKKKSELKRIRETTTEEERINIREFTKTSLPDFYRFLQIFFQSASREVEMLHVRKADVKLSEQKFKVTVKKGKKYNEEWRTITDSALPFWEDIYALASKNQYLFSRGLVPGDLPIRTEQVTRRWRRHIKKKLGITADLYSLKHTFLDGIAAEAGDAGLKRAQEAAGHSTPVITMGYLPGEKERQHQRRKSVMVDF